MATAEATQQYSAEDLISAYHRIAHIEELIAEFDADRRDLANELYVAWSSAHGWEPSDAAAFIAAVNLISNALTAALEVSLPD